LGYQGRIQRPAGAAAIVFLDSRAVAVGGGAQLAENRPGRLPEQRIAPFEAWRKRAIASG
jgi:hypothetical protein